MVILICPAAGAAAEIVPIEGESFGGDLVSIGTDGRAAFRVVREDSTPEKVRVIPLSELVRWGHPVDPRPQTIVVLEDGSRLVAAADWSGGAAVQIEGNTITVLSDVFEEMRLPRAVVRGVVFALGRHPADRLELVDRVQGEPSPAPSLRSGEKEGIVGERENIDIAWLTNGDRLVGTLAQLAGGSLTFTTAAGAVKVPLSRVEAVVFTSGQPSVVSRHSSVVVGLRNGSVICANSVRGTESELVLKTASGETLSGGSLEDVVSLQMFGGPIVYLSDLKAAAYRHVSYLDIEWPYERDTNVAGGPLVVGGAPYLKGIGMHSASRLTYGLEGRYTRFDASVAVDDSAEGRGSVTFAAYLLRDGKRREAFKSDVVRGGEAPRPVSIDVTDADGLTLTVDYADRGDELDRADWLDARLVKEEM